MPGLQAATAKIGIEHRAPILMRVAHGDRSAVRDCLSEYGSFIWALAKRITASNEEAVAATEEIFIDIWRYSKRGEEPRIDEKAIITQIARRRLMKYMHQT